MRPPLRFLAVGDSKSADGTWNDDFIGLVRSRAATEVTPNQAVSGRRVSDLLSAIDADIAAANGTPQVIMYNLGVNDELAGVASDLPAWEANILTCWDKYHAAWPDAKLYAMRYWRRTGAADMTALNASIDACIAARDWAYAGPDERVFLENGDDGVIYTSDGIHPNAAGYQMTAEQWMAVLGVV